MNGYCECGCGATTKVSPINDRTHGWTKGEPRRFIQGHHNRLRKRTHVLQDRGYATSCWIWPGILDKCGYGRSNGRLVHQIYYETYVGPVPIGLELDHPCRQADCCNPAHLEPVTHAENCRRAATTRFGPGAQGFPASIRAARIAAGLSMTDLGHLIGVSPALISLWERGKSRVHERHMERLSSALPGISELPPRGHTYGQ